MNQDRLISEQLAECIAFLRQLQQEYVSATKEIKEYENVKIDLLHYIELDGGDYPERCKQATQLRQCLIERREFKNIAEEREPFAAFLSLPENKGLLDALGRVLGEVRKVEKYHESRSYRQRAQPKTNERETDNK